MAAFSRLGDGALVSLAGALLLWYRVRLALPAPLGGRGLFLRRVLEWGGGGPAGAPDPERVSQAARLVGLFRRALVRSPFGLGCVPRSLALARLLRLHGLPAEIRVGMRRAARGFTGHAWVEHHGAVMAERPDFVGTFRALSFAPATSSAPLRERP